MFSSLELLESRIAPAGVITLKAGNFAYILTGDAAANDLLITQNGAEITLTPQNGTEIRDERGTPVQQTTPITLRLAENDLFIDMGKGADALSLSGLTLPYNLSVNMGEADEPSAIDELEISNLRVGSKLSLVSEQGTVSISGEVFHVGFDTEIFSAANNFSLDVDSFYVGEDLRVDAIISNDPDTFTLSANKMVVYGNFDLVANIFADDPSPDAVTVGTVGATQLINVGGNLRVLNDSFGRSAVAIGAENVVVSGKLIVENKSDDINETLDLLIEADTIRLDGGLSITSKSTALTNVALDAVDSFIIDGPVTAKLTKSAGSLSIVSGGMLQISKSVNFSTKGDGLLTIQGGGDIFGKVTASLGSGNGEVTIRGADLQPLRFDGLTVKSPAKLPVTGSGTEVTVEDVSLFGNVSLLLGRGDDTVTINDSIFRSRVSISTGDGDDIVNIHTAGTFSSEFRGGLSISLGAGEDDLTLGKEEAFNENTALLIYGVNGINGGSGPDTYLATGRNLQFFKSFRNQTPFIPLVKGFESEGGID